MRGFAAGRERTFYRRKAPFEFQIGLPQHRFRICIEVTREINHGKQQIANLASSRGFIYFGAIELGFDLIGFLANFSQTPRADRSSQIQLCWP